MRISYLMCSKSLLWLTTGAGAALLVLAAACQQGVGAGQDDEGFDVCPHDDGTARLALIGAPQLCGSCDPTCYQTLDVPVDDDLTDENSDAVCFDEDSGGLVICAGPSSRDDDLYAFIANAPDSTVSKLNLKTGEEVGRYLVGLDLPGKRCSCHCGGCNQPSRTAVGPRGYGYIANRAFGGQGSVSKIAGDISGCVDRDEDGFIETSSGGSDVRPPGEDECVIWTGIPVGEPDCIPCPPTCEDDCNFLIDPECIPCSASCSMDADCQRSGVPRALAVDALNRLWVGNYYEKRFYVLSTTDGSLIETVDVDLRPYGAAIGPTGRVWYVDGCCSGRPIQYVNSATFEKSAPILHGSGCAGSYGITVDTKDRVILGGWPGQCVSRYDPTAGVWEDFTTIKNVGIRGVCIDENDGVWAAGHNPNPDVTSAAGADFVIRWDENGASVGEYTSSRCGIPIGVAADFWGYIWTVCQMSSGAMKIDYVGVEPNKIYDTGPFPYTYSDFTGFQRATVTAPEGRYIRLHDSDVTCEDDREPLWSQLYWDVATTAGTAVEFWGRTAETDGELVFAEEVLLARVPGDDSPASVSAALDDADVLNYQRYFEVTVRLLTTDIDDSPVFTNMRLVHYCQCNCDVDANCSSNCECDGDC